MGLLLAVPASTSAAAPANDDLASAPTTATGAQFTGTNVEATAESGEPDHVTKSSPVRSVWWNWSTAVGDSGTEVTVGLCGSNYDTTLGVYTGSTVSALTLVAGNDDGGGAFGGTTCPQNPAASSVTFAVPANGTYHIAVAGFNGFTGNIIGRFYKGPDTVIRKGPPDGATIATDSVAFGFGSTSASLSFMECSLDGGAFVDCSGGAGTKSYSGLSNGPHTFSVRASANGHTDPDPATIRFTVNTPTSTSTLISSPTPTILADRTPPGVTGYAMGSRFKAASSGGSVGTAVGTRVSFRLTEAAAMKFAVVKDLSGRRVGRRCVPPSRSNRKRKKCVRTVTVGTFAFAGHAGANGFRFTGRMRGRKLAAGNYRLVETAKDAAGNLSRPQSRSFKIVLH
jgi:hypothetical protein